MIEIRHLAVARAAREARAQHRAELIASARRESRLYPTVPALAEILDALDMTLVYAESLEAQIDALKAKVLFTETLQDLVHVLPPKRSDEGRKSDWQRNQIDALTRQAQRQEREIAELRARIEQHLH